MAKTELEKVQAEAKKLGVAFKEDDTLETITSLVEAKKAEPKKKKSSIVLKDVEGNEVDEKDYFWPATNKDTKEVTYAPDYFQKQNGYPVDREDMLQIFNKIFNPKDGFLFYKDRNSELYLVIVPLKHAATIGEENNSIGHDFQKHAISFIVEGSVNLDTLKRKLELVRKHRSIKFDDR